MLLAGTPLVGVLVTGTPVTELTGGAKLAGAMLTTGGQPASPLAAGTMLTGGDGVRVGASGHAYVKRQAQQSLLNLGQA